MVPVIMHKVTRAFWMLGWRRRTGFSCNSKELIEALPNSASSSKSILHILIFEIYSEEEEEDCDSNADLEKVEQERMRKSPFPNCSRTTGWQLAGLQFQQLAGNWQFPELVRSKTSLGRRKLVADADLFVSHPSVGLPYPTLPYPAYNHPSIIVECNPCLMQFVAIHRPNAVEKKQIRHLGKGINIFLGRKSFTRCLVDPHT